MTRYVVKQVFIASIFFSILFGFGFLLYLDLKPKPSCSDGIINQGEEEIDCGGPCVSCELTKIEDLEVLWVKIFSGEDNFHDLAAQIKNPNQNYGSGNISYKFTLYDSANNIITEYFGATFILPNQTKYLLKTRLENPKLIKRIDLSFGKVEWEKPFTYEPVQLVVQRKEYHLLEESERGYSQIKALLINQTNFDFEKVDIDILLFNSSHDLVAINTTELRMLSSGQKRDFVATWYKKLDGQISFIEIEPETNIFDSSNFISSDTSKPEPFQEY